MAKQKKRYKITWERGGYIIGEEKPLTEEEKEFRSDHSCYYQNGQPKESEMVCMQQSYRNMIGTIHGHQCAGNICYFYANGGCDQHGCEWN